MADLAAVRQAIADKITASGTRAFAYAPDTVTPPVAIVWPASGDFLDTVTFEGADEYQLRITVLVPKGSDRTAQSSLDALLPAVEAAVIADQTLAGTAEFVGHYADSNYSLVTWGDSEQYLGADMSFTVGVS